MADTTANINLNVNGLDEAKNKLDGMTESSKKLGEQSKVNAETLSKFAEGATKIAASAILLFSSSETEAAKLQKSFNQAMGALLAVKGAMQVATSATQILTAAQLALNKAMAGATTAGGKLTSVLKYVAGGTSGIAIGATVAIAALAGLAYGMYKTIKDTNEAIDALGGLSDAIDDIGKSAAYQKNLTNLNDALEEAKNNFKVANGEMTQDAADAAKKTKDLDKETSAAKLKLLSDYQVEYAVLATKFAEENAANEELNTKTLMKGKEETSFEFNQRVLAQQKSYQTLSTKYLKEFEEGKLKLTKLYKELGLKADAVAAENKATIDEEAAAKAKAKQESDYKEYLSNLKSNYSILYAYEKAKIENKYSLLEDSDENQIKKLNELNALELKYVEKQYKALLITETEYNTKVIELDTELELDLRDRKKEADDKKIAEEKDYQEKLAAYKKEMAEKEISDTDKKLSKELAQLKLLHLARTTTLEEDSQFELMLLKLTAMEKLVNYGKDSQEYLDAAVAVAEKEKQIREGVTAKTEEEAQKQLDAINNVLNAISQIGSGIQDLFSQAYKNAKIESDNYYGSELEKLDNLYENKRLTEDQYNSRKEALDKKRNAQEKEMKIKAAEAEKLSALFGATINTAQAVTAALTVPIIGEALAVIVAALGAAQIALIASQPIPEYADGGLIRAGSPAPRQDDVPIMASRGEYVINADSAAKNYGLLDAINNNSQSSFAKEIAANIAHSINTLKVVNVATDTKKVSDRVVKIRNTSFLR